MFVRQLKIDKQIESMTGKGLTTRCKYERAVMYDFLHYMAARGWQPCMIDDMEAVTKIDPLFTDEYVSMEIIFNLDECIITFQNITDYAPNRHAVQIILGNEPFEMISDWNYFEDDRDEFNKDVSTFSDGLEDRVNRYRISIS